VQFGLQFQEIGETAADTQEGEAESDTAPDKDLKPARPPAQHKGSRPAGAKLPTPANPEPAAPEPTANSETAKTPPDEKADKPAGGGEVVRLDRFRKK
jgi:hypothetical protein